MDLLPLLLGAVCVLVAVAVVGHGIWLVGAWIVSAAAPPDRPRPGESNRPGFCSRCGLTMQADRCRACDWPAPCRASSTSLHAALGGLEQQIERLNALRLLDPAAYQGISQVIAAERQRLLETIRAAEQATSQARPTNVEIISAAAVEEPVRPRAAQTAEPPQAHPAPPDEREFASEVPLAARAAQFAAARSDVPQESAAAPAEPRRTWVDLLAAFMEERNMRWGEMVGGLLIVCCSIALVISFWSEIAQRPWLKFFVFGGVTAGLFGVGFYSEHRWRLHTTSQGLLLIANMLVPLNFLAIAAFSDTASTNAWLTVAGEAISACLFAALVYWAGKILVERGAPLLVAGMLVPCLAQLLARRYVDPTTATQVLAVLVGIPIVCYLVVNVWMLRWAGGVMVLSEETVNSIFKFFGLTSFATVLPLALVLFKTGQPLETLRQLAPMPCILGLVPLAAGLTLWQKLAGRGLPALRTAGTSLAVFGALVSLGGVVLGWPDPRAMLPAALVEFAVFTFVAWRFSLPPAHVLAAGCLATGYLLGVYLLDHQIAWAVEDPLTLAQRMLSGPTGTLLAPLVLAYAAAAYGSLRRKHRAGGALAVAAGALAAISVALVSWFGFGVEGDPVGAGWVYLLYAAGCVALAARSQRASIAWLASALLLSSIVQEVVFHRGAVLGLAQPEITAILCYSTLSAAIAAVLRWSRLARHDSPAGHVFWNASFFCSLVAAGWSILILPHQSAALVAGIWFWLALVWLAVVLATGWLGVWTLFQLALGAATIFAAVAQLEKQPWFGESSRPWLDPWTLEAVGIALAALSFAWTLLRIVCRRESRAGAPDGYAAQAAQVLATPWLLLDRVTSGALAALLVAIAAYAAIPGTLQELSPRPMPAAAAPAAAAAPEVASSSPSPADRVVPPLARFQWQDIPCEHAAGRGGWLLLASVLVLLATVVLQSRSSAWLACLFVAAAASCPLLASLWQGDVAVASALRWLSAGFLLAGSVPIWGRRWVARVAERLGWQLAPTRNLASYLSALVFFLGVFAPLAMALGVALAALGRSPRLGALWSDSLAFWIAGATAIVIALALRDLAQRALPVKASSRSAMGPRATPAIALALGAVPILSAVLAYVALALSRSPILGPEPSSVFARMGPSASYAVPVVVTALVLVGYAIRQRASGFALAGGLALNVAATIAYLFWLPSAELSFDAEQWLRLAQLNAAVAACYSIAWLMALAGGKRLAPAKSGQSQGQSPTVLGWALNAQLALAPALTAWPLGWAWCKVVWEPTGDFSQPYVMPLELADPWGLGSFALVCASVCAALWLAGKRVGLPGLSALLFALAIFAAATAARWDTTANWLSYNTLSVSHCLIAALLLTLAWGRRHGWLRQPGAAVARESNERLLAGPRAEAWIVLQGLIVSALAVREVAHDRLWTAGSLGFLGVLLAPALAWLFQRRRYLYVAAPLINAAGVLVADHFAVLSTVKNFVYLNVALLALPVAAWLVVELRGIRPRRSTAKLRAAPFHRVATRVALVVLAICAAVGLFADAAGHSILPGDATLGWIALAVTAVAAVACLWDAEAGDSVAGLYVLGLVSGAMWLHQFKLSPPWLLWTGTMLAAAYALATSYLWSRRRGLRAMADALGIPRSTDSEFAGLNWLVPCNLLLVWSVVLMTLVVELTDEDVYLRQLAAQATLVQVVSLALLARGDRRGVLQQSALQLGAVGAVMFAFAPLGVGTTLTLVHCLVALAAALAVVAVFYGFALGKLLRDASDWLPPARRLTPPLAALSAAALVALLGAEGYQFSQHGGVAIAWPAIVVAAVTLAGLCVAALAAAVLPGRDPLGLSARGRTLYVYAAEILMAMLFAHFRLTMPWLFTGLFQQYWPLVVMAIAFAGVGFAEFCRRRKQEVLAAPIENTGALLPVLPVLGFWAADTRVDYSLLLVSVGVLYAGLSIARRSFGFGLLAALAANGGLWYFLNRQEGLAFLAHPQIWLIPPALCVLAAAYANRRQLGEAQMSAVRYLASMTVYLSSTGDIFLNGVAQAPGLPLVLAAISIVGIFAGMLLRVRAFLFLGTGFLALALFTIIWHAAVDLHQTWIWWASGIVLGLLILAMFAVFEKKRQDVLELFDKIKQWEG